MRVKQQLLENQVEADALSVELRRVPEGSDRYLTIIEQTKDLNRRRSELHLQAEADRAELFETSRANHAAIHASYVDKVSELERRLAAAREARRITIDIIKAAAPAELPGILDELKGRKGGEA